MNSPEYLRGIYKSVHAVRRSMLSDVDKQCVDKRNLPLRFLRPIPTELIEQQRQLLGKSVGHPL